MHENVMPIIRNAPNRFTRRQFAAGVAGAMMATAAGGLHGETTKRRNTFVVAPNCYPMAVDFAQFLEQVKNTPLRKVELPTGAVGTHNLIPEWMVDVPLGGKWRNSLPDLKQLLVNGRFQAECVGVVGNIGYPGSEHMVKHRIDFAEQLGAKIVNIACDPGIIEKYRAFVYSMLRDVGLYAAEKGVCIAVETWGGIAKNATEALRTMREVGLSNVGINLDTGNVLIANADMDAATLGEEIRQLAKHVVYVHLKDVVRKPGGKSVTTVLGQGEIDFRRIFNILHDAGFYGPFGFDLETTHACQSGNIRESQKDLLASIEYLRSLGEFDQQYDNPPVRGIKR